MLSETTTTEPEGDQESQPQETAEAQADQTQTEPEGSDETVAAEATTTESEDVNLEWLAQTKGVDINDPKAVAEAWRKAEQEFHKSRQEAGELRKEAETAADANTDPYWREIQKLSVRQSVSDFYAAHPEARELDLQMAALVKDKPYLAGDIEALYKLAKADKYEAEIKTAEQRGREQAKQEIAKASTAGIRTGNASASAPKTEQEDRLSRFSDW